jgi:DNA-binding transcriptional LysR family regulator
MSLAEPDDSVPLLRSGDLDLVLVFDSGGPRADDGLDRVHLLEDPMYLALPLDHPLAHRRRVRLADLAGEPWVAGTPDCECNNLISRACAVAGYQPRIAFETDDYTSMQGFVAAGVGVSLIAELGLTSVRDDIVIRDLGRETPIRQIYAATLAEGYRAPATQAMLAILKDVAGRHESRRSKLALVG